MRLGISLKTTDIACVLSGVSGAPSPFVVAIWGQSGLANILNDSYDGTSAEALVAQDQVTFWWHDRATDGVGGVQSVTLNDTTAATSTVTASMVAMANVFMRQTARKVHLIFNTMSGTSAEEIMDDTYVPNNPDGLERRRWQDDWALHQEAVAAIGHPVEYLLQQWYASQSTWATKYGRRMFAFLTGRDSVDGSALNYSEASPLDLDGINIQRTLADLYGTLPTIIKTPGNHCSPPREDLTNAITRVGGAVDFRLEDYQQCNESWRAVTGDAALASYFTAAETFSLQGYAKGYESTETPGTWVDVGHPTGDTEQGNPRWSRYIAHTILRGAGFTDFIVPEFDQSEWQPDGSYVEVWSSAGSITTHRGGTGPTATPAQDHWTDALGFEINGAPAERAEIQPNGRVRIYPNSGSFTSGTVLQFGRGGGTGMLLHDTDLLASLWQDYPIVDVGLPDVTGIPVKGLHPDTISSTIVGNPTFTFGASGPYFVSPSGIGSGVSGFTGYYKGSFSSLSGTGQLFGLASFRFNCQVLNTGAIRVNAQDSGGTVLSSTDSAANTIQTGLEYEIVASIDLSADFARVWVNGTQVINATLTTGTGVFPDVVAHALADEDGTEQMQGEAENVRIWLTATSDDTLPSGTPYVEITGPQSTAESSTWAQP